ncbi:DNA/RNA nuclease SfsA [Lyngbya confervoides]|uniref:Sugar fermentation stimulation protein homolog n=1 Tax=Lyngbya confervoides BDU141951 TaxID=1574623 RepID=A0ABD4TA50_9CYAN|nr:DNA/RNA nuclease SfsA [Lyngbya confervoides]MCM1985145.1 DNA/RNA nuclease SfsA [Lyngbya confervoides BDU141951]
MAAWFYPYPPLIPGTLIKRYKRFFADIELEDGTLITAHCPNTGPMTGICIPGQPVMVSESHNPKRKLKYSWELIQVDSPPTWVGVNTHLPNRVVHRLLTERVLAPLAQYEELKMEVPYGQERSRVDFLLTSSKDPSIYVEVKNTTWAEKTLALFPDTVTTRGQKHIRELVAMLPSARVSMLYFVNRGDCTAFAPGDCADPLYGQLLRSAIAQGLEVYACSFNISPEGLWYQGLLELQI